MIIMAVKLSVAFLCALASSIAAMWYWCYGKGRPLQSRKSRLWLGANIVVMSVISSVAAIFIPVTGDYYWLESAALPSTLAGSKSLEKVGSDTDRGSGNPLAQLLKSVIEIATWLVAPLRTILHDHMRRDMMHWVERIDGRYKPYASWNWHQLRGEADDLYGSLALYVEDDSSRLGQLEGKYKLIKEEPPASGPGRDVALRLARKSYAEMRLLAYIWGYDLTQPSEAQSGKGLKKCISALKPEKSHVHRQAMH